MAHYLDDHRWPWLILAAVLTALLLWMREKGWLPKSTWKFVLVVIAVAAAAGIGIAIAVSGAPGGRNERPDALPSRVGFQDSMYKFETVIE